jgi:DNA-directed RNA polymerase specialized sigma24 family protein
MEKDVEQSEQVEPTSYSLDPGFEKRRAVIEHTYHALPSYGSRAFWQVIESHLHMPIEVLVKVLREAVGREDLPTQHHLFEVIIARIQAANEQWIERALYDVPLLSSERRAMLADLYADLCETLLRALRDPQQRYWEENFLHRLRFARKHVYESFLRREAHWLKQTAGHGKRVPHTLVQRLECIDWDAEDEHTKWKVFDEGSQQALDAVELAYISEHVLRLPPHLRAVVWLVYWEDCAIKTVGERLDLSPRMVRYRLEAALALLREALEEEE